MGDDGLKLADLPDLKVEQRFDGAGDPAGGPVSFLNVPATVVFRKSVSKAGHVYFGFLPAEACTRRQVWQPNAHHLSLNLGSSSRAAPREVGVLRLLWPRLGSG